MEDLLFVPALKTIYHSFIYSKCQYGIILYSAASSSDLNKPVERIGLKIHSEERVSIIIDTTSVAREFFYLLTTIFFWNKNWLLSDRFRYDFSDPIIGIYNVIEL